MDALLDIIEILLNGLKRKLFIVALLIPLFVFAKPAVPCSPVGEPVGGSGSVCKF